MSGRDPNRPIIVKKIIEEGGHGHHGGAWKVAYADFVTAMMAFFLLMWLLTSANKAKLAGLAEFFTDPKEYLMKLEKEREKGTGTGILKGMTIEEPSMLQQPVTSPFNITQDPPRQEGGDLDIEIAQEFEEVASSVEESMKDDEFEAERERRQAAMLEDAKAAIAAALDANPELDKLRESLMIDQTPEGLRIQIVDREQYAMFPSGSDQMYPPTKRLIEVVVNAIKDMPNKISIRGHTDATPFVGVGNDNWRLSSGRAIAARSAMVEAGLPEQRIAEVIGKADTEPLLPEAPKDPRNRRLSIVLLNHGPVGTGAVSTPPTEAAVPPHATGLAPSTTPP